MSKAERGEQMFTNRKYCPACVPRHVALKDSFDVSRGSERLEALLRKHGVLLWKYRAFCRAMPVSLDTLRGVLMSHSCFQE